MSETKELRIKHLKARKGELRRKLKDMEENPKLFLNMPHKKQRVKVEIKSIDDKLDELRRTDGS